MSHTTYLDFYAVLYNRADHLHGRRLKRARRRYNEWLRVEPVNPNRKWRNRAKLIVRDYERTGN